MRMTRDTVLVWRPLHDRCGFGSSARDRKHVHQYHVGVVTTMLILSTRMIIIVSKDVNHHYPDNFFSTIQTILHVTSPRFPIEM